MELDLTHTDWLGITDDWRAKLAERKRKRHGKERKPGAPPVSVQDKQDADSARLRAANRDREAALEAALLEHWPFAKFMTILREQEHTFNAPIAGVLDVDLAGLALHLKINTLPHAVKFLAVQEVHKCVRRVNKRVHGKPDDEIPFGNPPGTTFTDQDFKAALRIW